MDSEGDKEGEEEEGADMIVGMGGEGLEQEWGRGGGSEVML